MPPPAVTVPVVAKAAAVLTLPLAAMVIPVVPPLPTRLLVPRFRACVAVWLPRLSAEDGTVTEPPLVRLMVEPEMLRVWASVGRVVAPRLPLASAVTILVPVAVRLCTRTVPATSSLALGAVVPVPMPTLPAVGLRARAPAGFYRTEMEPPAVAGRTMRLEPLCSSLRELAVEVLSKSLPNSTFSLALPAAMNTRLPLGSVARPRPILPPLKVSWLPAWVRVVAWLSVPPSWTAVPLRVRPLLAVVLSPVGTVAALRLPLASAVTMRVPVPVRPSRRTVLVVPPTCSVAAGVLVPMPTLALLPSTRLLLWLTVAPEPRAVALLRASLPTFAPLPIRVLLEPVTLAWPVPGPMNTLLPPEVVLRPLLKPLNTLLTPVLRL